MGKVVIYTHTGSWVENLYRPIAQALEEMGYETIVLDANEKDYTQRLVDVFRREKVFNMKFISNNSAYIPAKHSQQAETPLINTP